MLHGFPVTGCPHFIAPVRLTGDRKVTYSSTPGLLGVFVLRDSALQVLHVYHVDDASIIPSLLHRVSASAVRNEREPITSGSDHRGELYYDFFAMPGSSKEERIQEAHRVRTLAGVVDTDPDESIHAVS